MAKKQIRQKSENKNIIHKTMGRSWGKPVVDPVLNDTVSAKIFAARKKNNPNRYKNK